MSNCNRDEKSWCAVRELDDSLDVIALVGGLRNAKLGVLEVVTLCVMGQICHRAGPSSYYIRDSLLKCILICPYKRNGKGREIIEVLLEIRKFVRVYAFTLVNHQVKRRSVCQSFWGFNMLDRAEDVGWKMLILLFFCNHTEPNVEICNPTWRQ